jgi:hypothetical protein
MGGLGSGRNPETFTVERTPELDVALLDNGGALDEPGRGGNFTWQSRPVGVFEFRFMGDALMITEPFEQGIPIIMRETPSGTAEFPLFCCPSCSRPRRKLYLKPLTWDTLSCRDCLNLVYKRSRISGSPRRVGAYKVAKLKRQLQAEEAAAAAENARHSEKRAQRIEELEAELEQEEAAQRKRMWRVVEDLHADLRNRLGYDPFRRPEGPGLDKPLAEASDEEIARAMQPIVDAPRWPMPGD